MINLWTDTSTTNYKGYTIKIHTVKEHITHRNVKVNQKEGKVSLSPSK
jgi:hypothetical protein